MSSVVFAAMLSRCGSEASKLHSSHERFTSCVSDL